LPHFQHIVIVFQENRTPDNLFGAGPMTGACGRTPFEPGVDIADSGPNKVTGGVTCLSPLHLSVSGVDPDHRYNPAWINEYDGGKMDGACENTFLNPNGEALPQCPQYTYVFQSDVQPYFDLATSYGFANYMFESSEGPSFPAHQFILAGTSAPVPPGNTGFNYFDAENPNFNDSGCPFPQSQPFWVDPLGNETTKSAELLRAQHADRRAPGQGYLAILHTDAGRHLGCAGGDQQHLRRDRQPYLHGTGLRQRDLAGQGWHHTEPDSVLPGRQELQFAADELGHTGLRDVGPSDVWKPGT
jgi:hypothetical protein